jgi:hypothetical protein
MAAPASAVPFNRRRLLIADVAAKDGGTRLRLKRPGTGMETLRGSNRMKHVREASSLAGTTVNNLHRRAIGHFRVNSCWFTLMCWPLSLSKC